jgi:endothelin-converting enzyme/putative endopeptidase
MSRSILCWLALLALVGSLSAQTPAQKPEPVLDVSSMDASVNPCEDFYNYSCGGWMKKNPIPPDQISWGVSTKLQDENLLVLRDILEKAAEPDPNRNAITQKIGDYYAACMDEKSINAAELAPLKKEIQAIDRLQSKEDIAALAASMIDDDVLFDFHSNQDYKNSEQVIAEVDQGGISLPDRDFYLLQDSKTIKLRKEYVAHVRRMFDLLGDAPGLAEDESHAVMRIETALAKGSMSRVDRRDPPNVYHKMSRTDLQALSPNFQWDIYFEKVGLLNLTSLNVADPGFFKTMNAQLKKEDLASWKAYSYWHLAHANAPYLSAGFVNLDFDFYGRTLQGAKQIAPRWKRCVNATDNDLGEALGQAYVERAFSPEAKQHALNMVKQIESAMQSDIESLPWMTAITKQHAIEKLHAVVNRIGYPDKWRDYSALQISRDDELGNIMRAREFEFRRQLGKIGKPVDRMEWEMTPPTVNAYYDEQLNDINFPAGTLQPPLFDPNGDDAANYGDIGATFGHELTHAFDDEGRQFDARGNLRDWWTLDDTKQFAKRAGCIASQYSHYTAVDDIKVNGQLTLGENVADLGGLMVAYLAWHSTKGQNIAPIDGFTPEQRFFISYGQSWCTNTRPETERVRTAADPHSPEKYRVNGVVSNMPEFGQAFHCKAGSPMMRKDPCKVW